MVAPIALASDEALVRRVLAGEVDMFETLIGRYGDTVFRVASRIVGPSEAEDVAQDVLLRAFNSLDSFRGDASFKTWLLRITHNTALNALARRRALPMEEPPEESGSPLGASTAERTPAEQLEARERAERLESKLLLLRPPHRTVLVLRELEGLTYDEIALVTDTPIGSVKGRLHRARDEMVEILRNNTYDWDLPR